MIGIRREGRRKSYISVQVERRERKMEEGGKEDERKWRNISLREEETFQHHLLGIG
jgi:hypothetical protein